MNEDLHTLLILAWVVTAVVFGWRRRVAIARLLQTIPAPRWLRQPFAKLLRYRLPYRVTDKLFIVTSMSFFALLLAVTFWRLSG